MSQKPNILYINSHDTGRYIQPYGHPVPTPNIQRLAEQGALFRQCFTINPTCSPSRSALLTGCYPHENGMTGLAHRGFKLNNPKDHILHTLKENGYETFIANHQHLYVGGDICKDMGYDRNLGEHKDDQGFFGALKFLKEEKHTKPFYLEIGFHETHHPFPNIPNGKNPKYTMPPAPLPDVPEIRKGMAKFADAAQILDQKMGAIFDALETAGVAENTLIICTTDHGIPFPRMKCSLTDHGTGVFLIIRGPGGFTGGKVIDGMVTHMDIFPTICDLIGAKHPSRLRGKSLLPLVKSEQQELHEEIFGEVNWHACFEPMRCVRTKRYKYIRRYSDYKKTHRPNLDGYKYIEIWKDHDFDNYEHPQEELYDLLFDPNESNNLAAKPEMKNVLSDMKKRMENWQKQTSDPLLTNTLTPPVGAWICRCDAPNTKEGIQTWDGKQWIDRVPNAAKTVKA